MTDSRHYPAEVFWSDEDEGFIAIAPDLPGCSAWGSNRADALHELGDAIDAWIAAAKAAGNPVPEPSARGAAQHSGRFVVRVPRRLHAQLAAQAQRENTSLNQYVVYLLTLGSNNQTAHMALPQIAHTLLASAATYPGYHVATTGMVPMSLSGCGHLLDEGNRATVRSAKTISQRESWMFVPQKTPEETEVV